ncbi:DUF3052 domain-containing protein [Pelomonas sp. APW6]|uniref:DUF3052 domain-containing protein n=1 Tax=Roseateles subflavus TaxID=3053353 RepID=A0ABT7LG69_9BURK|nr:DUF3052 domain-containing protein [Pelomonas sp. APW6]MDL5031851.1 DUF3052 domain-containing protein [Pelomonas sp. APW6]
MTPAGYSGTPLARKLGLEDGQRLLLLGAPPGYLDTTLVPRPPALTFVETASPAVDIAHAFLSDAESLAALLRDWRRTLRPDAVVWISWPKKASRVPTTITEDVIREQALPLGWVDVKVCAVDAVWSGLKLVVRQALR